MCSGIQGASLAWLPFGWECAAVAEVDPAACSVLRHHYPKIPNAGDFTTIKGDEYGTIDLVAGGTRLVSFLQSPVSEAEWAMIVATWHLNFLGLLIAQGPDGWSGRTSPEFYQAYLTTLPIHVRRRHQWIWSKTDRKWILKTSTKVKNYTPSTASWPDFQNSATGWAYRILDAQHFGVPQRRRRVFVVGYLGDRPCRAAAVLFESDRLQGNPPPSRKAGQGFTHSIAPSLAASGRGLNGGDSRGQDPVVAEGWGGNNTAGPIGVATAVNAHGGPSGRMDFESETFVTQTVATLDASYGKLQGCSGTSSDGGGVGPPTIAIQERAICENPDAGPDGAGIRTDGNGTHSKPEPFRMRSLLSRDLPVMDAERHLKLSSAQSP